jgi:hypothetical protein
MLNFLKVKTIMMKKFCKLGLYLSTVFTSAATIAQCDSLAVVEIQAPNTTSICKPHLEVFFGYNTKHKAPSWGVYKMKSSILDNPPVYLRYNGSHLPVPEVKHADQLKPSQIIASGLSKAFLIPHYNVLNRASQVNKFISMANVVPVNSKDWRERSSDLMFELGANEREMLLAKGDFMVFSGVVYHDKKQKGVVSAKYIYKVYYHSLYDYTLSYLVPIKPNSPDLNKYITSINCIEKVSGHKLFSGYPLDVQKSIKNGVAFDKEHWAAPNSEAGICVLPN